MLEHLEYKGYLAHVEFDSDDNIFWGEVVKIRKVITFEGKTVDELRQAFVDSIEAYLASCAKQGKMPAKPTSTRSAQQVELRNKQVYRWLRNSQAYLSNSDKYLTDLEKEFMDSFA